MPGALSIRSRAVRAIRRLQCLSSLYGGIHGEGDEGKREKGRGFGILSLIIRLPERCSTAEKLETSLVQAPYKIVLANSSFISP